MLYEVIIDIGETPNKCTIAPLADRTDFRIFPVKGNRFFGPLSSSILLHHEGECLTHLKKSRFNAEIGHPEVRGIATVDCVWDRLDGLLKRVVTPLPVLARIPQGFETAYPRKSKDDTDPEGGLATIEAIFVAAALLGKWDATLFSEYYFGQKFIEINQKRFLDLGVAQAADPLALPTFNFKPNNSLERRKKRGKLFS